MMGILFWSLLLLGPVPSVPWSLLLLGPPVCPSVPCCCWGLSPCVPREGQRGASGFAVGF